MKPPPSVEEIAAYVADREWTGDDYNDAEIARSILARVRESVPHIAGHIEWTGTRYVAVCESHSDPEGTAYCREVNGAHAWEEPK